MSPQGKTPVTRYSLFALQVIAWCARPTTLVFAVLSIVVWALFGPACDWDNGWQLTINTGTTVITFLLGFIIVNAHEVGSSRVEAKLDRVISLLEIILEKRQ